MTYLLRDDKTGFRDVAGAPVNQSREPLRPQALTPAGAVVYAKWKQQGFGLEGIYQLAIGGMQRRTALKAYNKSVSQIRRREFETELARDAGTHTGCVKTAVDRVTSGIKGFIGQRTDSAGGAVKARCYNDTGSGRLGTSTDDTPLSDSDAWTIACQTLDGKDIPKILGIHNCIHLP